MQHNAGWLVLFSHNNDKCAWHYRVLQFGQLLTDLHWCHQNYKKSLIQHYFGRLFQSFKLRSHDVYVHSFNLLQLQITSSGSVQLCHTPRWLNRLQTPLHNRNYWVWMSGKDKGRMWSRWLRRFCLLHGPGKMMKRRWKEESETIFWGFGQTCSKELRDRR